MRTDAEIRKELQYSENEKLRITNAIGVSERHTFDPIDHHIEVLEWVLNDKGEK